jgi:hypothetical protein
VTFRGFAIELVPNYAKWVGSLIRCVDVEATKDLHASRGMRLLMPSVSVFALRAEIERRFISQVAV